MNRNNQKLCENEFNYKLYANEQDPEPRTTSINIYQFQKRTKGEVLSLLEQSFIAGCFQIAEMVFCKCLDFLGRHGAVNLEEVLVAQAEELEVDVLTIWFFQVAFLEHPETGVGNGLVFLFQILWVVVNVFAQIEDMHDVHYPDVAGASVEKPPAVSGFVDVIPANEFAHIGVEGPEDIRQDLPTWRDEHFVSVVRHCHREDDYDIVLDAEVAQQLVAVCGNITVEYGFSRP